MLKEAGCYIWLHEILAQKTAFRVFSKKFFFLQLLIINNEPKIKTIKGTMTPKKSCSDPGTLYVGG